MARALRVQFDGALYHLVVRANNRQPLFRDQKDRRHYLELLSRYQGRFGFKIYCYLLVSRKVRLLLETPGGNVGKIMQCLGTSYTSYFNRRHKRRGTLFEGRYNSYLVDRETSLAEVTRYIHRACFRTGLSTEKEREYPWSSYRIYLGRKRFDLVETEPVLSRFGRDLREKRRRYQAFVENGNLRGNSHPIGLHSPYAVMRSGFVEKIPLQSGTQQNNDGDVSLRVAERILREVSLSLSSNEVGDLWQNRQRALARHVAMYLLRKQTSLPLRAIGALLGVKAPAVSLGIGKVEQLLKREDFSKKVKSLLENDALTSSQTVAEYAPVQKELSDGNTVA